MTTEYFTAELARQIVNESGLDDFVLLTKGDAAKLFNLAATKILGEPLVYAHINPLHGRIEHILDIEFVQSNPNMRPLYAITLPEK